jgi:hypothetical protein
MGSLIATLFKENNAIPYFREAMIALDSTFSFEREDMLEIGQVYSERYPESYSKRNTQHVQIGYSMARICIMEKALADIPSKNKNAYRNIFYDLDSIEEKIAHLIQSAGCEQIAYEFVTITGRIKDLEVLIDSLHRGMIKEKFIGGLSVIYNVIYLFHYFIKKCLIENKGL